MNSSKSVQIPQTLHVALVAMPWHLFNRPSIQLASLKAYLKQNTNFVEVDTFHPYLEVAHVLGGEVYHWISQNVWVCEALYSAILFPEQRETSRKIIEKALRKTDKSIVFEFDDVVLTLQSQLNKWIQSNDWQHFDLVGFSVCFNQLLSSLTAAKALKEKHPDLPVVFGGSTCAPDVASSLLENFSQIDYVIFGEGEKPLLDLCEFLIGKIETLASEIKCADDKNKSRDQATNVGQLDNLSMLPLPDYQDYFDAMFSLFKGEPFIPELPVEFSRGCWWGRCTFCNLNLQWCGYRFKKAEQVLSEIVDLSEKYGCLDFNFTDNVLPIKDSVLFFENLAKYKRDFRIFAEIRIPQNPAHLSVYRKGGLDTVQVGIEALSNSLLKRMQKGNSVIENIAVMKNCHSCGIKMEGNLITEFPGSTQDEVNETLKNLDFVMPFSPLSTATFFLGLGSPVDQDPKRFGVTAIVHHPQNTKLFPKEILKKLVLLIKDYRGDRKEQRKKWASVVVKVKQWHDFHQKRKKSVQEKPALSYREGGDYIIIRQELPGKKVLRHRLRGPSRQIYLACEQICNFEELKQLFPKISAEKLLKFIDDLVQKRVMFKENNRYLALAVHDQ